MARSKNADYLQNFRFGASATDATGRNKFLPVGRPEAGFATMGSPSSSTDAVEYREGQYIYTRKQPGIPKMEDIECTRGVTRGDTSFYDWLLNVKEGGDSEYRADVDLYHYGRRALVAGSPIIKSDAKPDIIYHLYEAFPIREKTTADLEGTSSEISIATLGIAYESYKTDHLP